MQGYFVSGTDTGVGKTELACALAAHWQQQGKQVAVRKPVESGCEIKEGRLIPADATQLQQAAGGWESLETICPYRFAPALSPEAAALQTRQTLTLAQLIEACQTPAQADKCLVEGAGGFLSPIATEATNADLAAALQFPVLLVVADKLGCINHTLLTAAAIESRGLTLAKVYVMANEDEARSNVSDLKRWLSVAVEALPQAGEKNPWQNLRNVLTSP